MTIKRFCALLALVLFASMSVEAMAVSSGTCGSNLTWTLSDNGVVTIRGAGAMTDFGASNSNSDAPWYSRTDVEHLVMEYGATSIGTYAFGWSMSLKDDLVIPSSVTRFGNNAFCYCHALNNVTIPTSVRSIGEYCFYRCDGLQSITIPDGITSIPKGAIGECENLKKIYLSNSVTSIADSAFINDTQLTDVYYTGSYTQRQKMTVGEYNDPLINATWHYDFAGEYTVSMKIDENHMVYDDINNYLNVTKELSETEIKRYTLALNLIVVFNNKNNTECIGESIQLDQPKDIPSPHYTFLGWSTKSNANTPEYVLGDFFTTNKDTTLYGVWSPKSYTVSFDANGGSADTKSMTVTYGDAYGTLPTATRSDHRFNGWYTSANGGTQITSDTTVNLTANQTLYAHWTYSPACYTLTFNANGGTVSTTSKTVTNGTTYGTLPTPTRIGYRFDGWYTYANGGTQITSSTTVNLTANQTLYAHWTYSPATYTVTFNANSGSVSTASKTVTNGSTYGTLPTPTRSNYKFDGWFTASSGGTQITSDTTVNLTANQTLYAHWTYSPASYTVTFNANGGSVSTASKTVTNGGTYGTLPTPTRSNYKFVGWFTASSGGTQITSSTTVNLTANQTLYAHWTYSPSTYTVTFNANGGTVTTTSKTVTNGSTYGTLPTPTRGGYQFDGWYTYDSGGMQITSSTTVNLTANQTLYAHWTKPQSSAFTWGKDNWNFINGYDYFYSGQMVNQISQSYLDVLAKNLTNKEYYYIFDRSIGWLYDTWGGSCYGMSSTALLSKQGLLPYSKYKSGATSLYQLSYPKADQQVESLVNYYQLLQVKDVIQQQYRTVPNRTHQENIGRIISLLDENDTVLVGFQKDGWGGHAILAYGYEYGSFTWNGVSYQGHIRICDPNCSKSHNDEYDIYFNTSSYRWIIPHYGFGSANGAVFNYVGANVSEINAGGYLSGGSNGSVSKYVGRIDVAAASKNRSVVKVSESNGSYVTKTNASDDIVEAYSYISSGAGDGMPGYNLFDASSAYRVSQYDAVELNLSIDYEKCALKGHSYAGKSVVFDKKGCVSITGESADYDMGMTFNSGYPTDWFSIQVSGSNASQMSLMLSSEGYIVSGDRLENVVAKASNRSDSAQVRFSTDFKSALLYEIDKSTMGVKVDTDGDGTYETKLTDVSTFCVPAALETIDESAFEGCAFTHVFLGDRVTAIGDRAFASCPRLVYIEIPDSVTFIAENAFAGSKDVTIVCRQGSAAYAYAKAHGIACRTTG